MKIKIGIALMLVVILIGVLVALWSAELPTTVIIGFACLAIGVSLMIAAYICELICENRDILS